MYVYILLIIIQGDQVRKLKKIAQVALSLKFFFSLFALCSLFPVIAMQRVSHLPVQLPAKRSSREPRFYDSLYSRIKQSPTMLWIGEKLRELVGAKSEGAKPETLELVKSLNQKFEDRRQRLALIKPEANIPSMFSRIQMDNSIAEKAKKSRELVMQNSSKLKKEVFRPNELIMSIRDMFSSSESLFLMQKKIKGYSFEHIVEGINYVASEYSLSNGIMDLFTKELVSRGYPYSIKGYENNVICGRLNPEVQKMLFIDRAILSLKNCIIDEKIDKETIQEADEFVYNNEPELSFNALAFSSHGDQLVVGASDGQNNNKLMRFLFRNGNISEQIYDLEKDRIKSLVLSHKDTSVAVAMDDGKFSVIPFDIENHNLFNSGVFAEFGQILSVGFGSDDKQFFLMEDALCILTVDDKGYIRKQYQVIKAAPEYKKFKTFIVSYSGESVFVGTGNGMIIEYISDIKKQYYIKQQYDMSSLDASINALAVSFDNKHFVVGAADKLVFGKFENKQWRVFNGCPVSSLAYIFDANKVVVQTYEGGEYPELFLAVNYERDLSKGLIEPIRPSFVPNDLGSPGGALSMAVSRNGEKIAVGFKGKLMVWNLLSSEDKKMFNGLRATLTRDHAQLISKLAKKKLLNKEKLIKLLPYEISDYNDLPSAVKDLLFDDIES